MYGYCVELAYHLSAVREPDDFPVSDRADPDFSGEVKENMPGEPETIFGFRRKEDCDQEQRLGFLSPWHF